MAVILRSGFSGAGSNADPDDEKARKTHALCQQWNMLLGDPNFVAKLPPGAKDSLEKAVRQVSFNLMVYRGELLKAQRARQTGSASAVLATTTFVSPNTRDPISIFGAMIAAAVATIAVVVVVSSKNLQILGNKLESSIDNLRSESEGVKRQIEPIPLNFTPNLSMSTLNDLIRRGIIILSASGEMAIDPQKIKNHVDEIFGNINKLTAAQKEGCSAAIAALTEMAENLREMAESLQKALTEGDPKNLIPWLLRTILDILEKLHNLDDNLNKCLKNLGPTQPPPKPTPKPN